MGCDIHTNTEVKKDWIWENVNFEPFGWRNYNMFSLLAGVRNYGIIKPMAEPRGLPDDVSIEVYEKHREESGDAHSESYLTLRELVEYDYSKPHIDEYDELITEDDIYTPLNFLSDSYFKDIEELKQYGDLDNIRVVFWFDN